MVIPFISNEFFVSLEIQSKFIAVLFFLYLGIQNWSNDEIILFIKCFKLKSICQKELLHIFSFGFLILVACDFTRQFLTGDKWRGKTNKTNTTKKRGEVFFIEAFPSSHFLFIFFFILPFPHKKMEKKNWGLPPKIWVFFFFPSFFPVLFIVVCRLGEEKKLPFFFLF